MEALPVTSSTEIQTQDLISQVIYWICEEALNREQAKKLIASNSPLELTEQEINIVIGQALEKLTDGFYSEYSDPEKIINQHVQWYEYIYSYFNSINNAAGCTKTMQAKEKLLRLLKDKNTVTFSKKQITITEDRKIALDLSLLTTEEQNRINYLLKKIKVNE